MHQQHFILGFLVGVFIVLLWQMMKCNIDKFQNLNPRWMMGGLRDDTGSRNAKDVFGMGFGVDQTKKLAIAADPQFQVDKGLLSRTVGESRQGEYAKALGEDFMDKPKDKLDNKKKEAFSGKTTEDYLEQSLRA